MPVWNSSGKILKLIAMEDATAWKVLPRLISPVCEGSYFSLLSVNTTIKNCHPDVGLLAFLRNPHKINKVYKLIKVVDVRNLGRKEGVVINNTRIWPVEMLVCCYPILPWVNNLFFIRDVLLSKFTFCRAVMWIKKCGSTETARNRNCYFTSMISGKWPYFSFVSKLA